MTTRDKLADIEAQRIQLESQFRALSKECQQLRTDGIDLKIQIIIEEQLLAGEWWLKECPAIPRQLKLTRDMSIPEILRDGEFSPNYYLEDGAATLCLNSTYADLYIEGRHIPQILKKYGIVVDIDLLLKHRKETQEKLNSLNTLIEEFNG